MGFQECVPVTRLVLGVAGGRHKAFRSGNLARFGAKRRGAGGAGVGRGGRWRVWSHSDSFFFKPAQTCGGEVERPKVVECELTRSVSKLEPMHVDAVSRHVSDQAADAVAGTVAKLGGGLLQMDFKVMPILANMMMRIANINAGYVWMYCGSWLKGLWMVAGDGQC